jgi:hypothetical protein
MTSKRKKGFRVYSDNCLIPPEDTGPGSLFPASEKALLLLYGDGSDSLQYNCIAIFLPHQGSLLSLSNNIDIPTDPSILNHAPSRFRLTSSTELNETLNGIIHLTVLQGQARNILIWLQKVKSKDVLSEVEGCPSW